MNNVGVRQHLHHFVSWRESKLWKKDLSIQNILTVYPFVAAPHRQSKDLPQNGSTPPPQRILCAYRPQ